VGVSEIRCRISNVISAENLPLSLPSTSLRACFSKEGQTQFVLKTIPPLYKGGLKEDLKKLQAMYSVKLLKQTLVPGH
jgi:hypothetical protein